MDFISSFNAAQDHPDFAKLSYNEQIGLRNTLFNEAMSQDPTFSQFSQDQLQYLYENTVYAPPIFQNRSTRNLIDRLVTARETDPQGSAGYGNRTNQMAYDDLYDVLSRANEGGLFMGLGQRAAGAVTQAFVGGTHGAIQNIVNDPDQHKIWEYLNAREVMSRPGSSSTIDNNVANFVSNILDFAAGTVGATIPVAAGKGSLMLAAPAGKVSGIALGSTFEGIRSLPFIERGIAAAATQGTKRLWRTVIPAAIEGVAVAGPAGVVVSKLNSMMNEDPSMDPFASFGNFALNYGAGVGFNVAGGFITRELIPHAILAARGLAGKIPGMSVSKARVSSQEEILSEMQKLIDSGNVPESMVKQLSDYQQALRAHRIEVDRIGKLNPALLTDEDRLFVGAHLASDDIVIQKLPEGKYRLYQVTPAKDGDRLVTNIGVKEADNVFEAMDIVGRNVAANVDNLRLNPQIDNPISKYAKWIYEWNESNIGASKNVESVVSPKPVSSRLPIQDRFYIGANEVVGDVPGVQMIPVKAPLDVSRIESGKQPIGYSDITPLVSDASNPNAIMLVRNALDIPADVYQSQGLGSIYQARMRGFDTVRLVGNNGEAIGYVPLTPSNIKVLASNVDVKGKPSANISRVMARNAAADPNYRASVQARVDATMPLGQVGDNAKLMTQFAGQRFGEVLDDNDIRLFAAAATGTSADRITIKRSQANDIIDSGRSVSVESTGDGGILVTAPRSLTTPASRLRFSKTLTYELGVLNNRGATQGMESTTNRILSQLKSVKNPETHPFFKIMDGMTDHGKIYGERLLSQALKKSLGIDLTKNANGVYSAMVRGNMVTGNLSDIYKAVRPDLVPEKALRDAITMQGAKISKQADGFIIRVPGEPSRKYPALSVAAEQMGIDTSILPSSLRPQFIELDPTGSQIKVYADGLTVSMDKRSAMQLANSFSQDSPVTSTEVIRREKGFAAYVERPDRIDVIDMESKTRMSFATPEEAKEFARTGGGLDQFNYTKEMARLHGMHVDYDRGTYVLRTGDPQSPVFKSQNIDDLNKVMSEYPTDRLDASEIMPYGDDIMKELPEDIVREWKSFNTNFQPMRSDIFEDYSMWTPQDGNAIRQSIANAATIWKGAYGKAVKDGKIHPGLQEVVSPLSAAHDANMSEWFGAQKLIGKIFAVGKKTKGITVGDRASVLSDDRQIIVGKHLMAQTAEDRALLQRDLPLTAAEQRMITNLRALTGIRSETGMTGLAAKFGIPYNRYQTNYMTRIRNIISGDTQLRDKLQRATTAKDMFSTLESYQGFGKGSLHEIRPWFEYARKQEFMDAIFEERAMPATLHYVQAGLRKFWMDVPLQKYKAVYATLNKAGLIPEDVKPILHPGDDKMEPSAWFSGLSNGVAAGWGERIIQNIGKSLAEKQGKVLARIAEHRANRITGIDPESIAEKQRLMLEAERYKSPAYAERGKKVLDDYMSLQYATMLGFKPMLAIRNVFQMYAMYAPMFGGDYLDDAIKWMQSAPKQELESFINRLMHSNDVGPQHPLAGEMSTEGALGKLVDVSLAMYRNVDTYTRTAGYAAALRRFADASEKLRTGSFGKDAIKAKESFIRYSKLSIFQKTDPQMVERIWQSAADGIKTTSGINPNGLNMGSPSLNSAAEMFAKEAVQATLFNYSAYNKPMMFSKGVVGKVFGQLGMFAASYRNYIAQALRNLTFPEMAAFAGSFIATNLALFTAFKVAGVKTNDFVPLMPGLIGMGPSAELITDALSAIRPGPDQAQAGKDILKFISPIVMKKQPGYGMTEILPGTEPTPTFNWPTVVPGSAQWYYLQKASGYMNQGDYYSAFLSLATAQVESDSVDLEIGTPFGDLVIPQGNPADAVRSAVDRAMEARLPFHQ